MSSPTWWTSVVYDIPLPTITKRGHEPKICVRACLFLHPKWLRYAKFYGSGSEKLFDNQQSSEPVTIPTMLRKRYFCHFFRYFYGGCSTKKEYCAETCLAILNTRKKSVTASFRTFGKTEGASSVAFVAIWPSENEDTGGEFTKLAFLVDASDDKSEVLGSSG